MTQLQFWRVKRCYENFQSPMFSNFLALKWPKIIVGLKFEIIAFLGGGGLCSLIPRRAEEIELKTPHETLLPRQNGWALRCLLAGQAVRCVAWGPKEGKNLSPGHSTTFSLLLFFIFVTLARASIAQMVALQTLKPTCLNSIPSAVLGMKL